MHSSAKQALVATIQQYFSIPPAEAELVLGELEPRVCKGGDWLFRQNEPADCLYLLARGRLQVWVNSADARDGAPKLLAEVEPGETVGEIGMLTGGVRSAGIRAVRNSLLLRMSSSAFDRLSRQRPELTRHIAGGIASRLRDRTAGTSPVRHRMRTVAFVPVDGGPQAEDLAVRLRESLRAQGETLVLTSRAMREFTSPCIVLNVSIECLGEAESNSSMRSARKGENQSTVRKGL